jgi:hypothetical protein
MVADLTSLSRREANILAFFTYDLNGDGFICEEDLYFFMEHLPLTAKIMQDITIIIEFLRKNKVRSSSTNLPKQILHKKQKTVVNSLWNTNQTASKHSREGRADQKDSKRFFSMI